MNKKPPMTATRLLDSLRAPLENSPLSANGCFGNYGGGGISICADCNESEACRGANGMEWSHAIEEACTQSELEREVAKEFEALRAAKAKIEEGRNTKVEPSAPAQTQEIAPESVSEPVAEATQPEPAEEPQEAPESVSEPKVKKPEPKAKTVSESGSRKPMLAVSDAEAIKEICEKRPGTKAEVYALLMTLKNPENESKTYKYALYGVVDKMLKLLVGNGTVSIEDKSVNWLK
jgi:hypothetical protein